MTRSEAYRHGWHEGRLVAEADITLGFQDDPTWDYGSISGDAFRIGYARGYRDTVARYEAGTLTRQMFEHAPRSGGR